MELNRVATRLYQSGSPTRSGSYRDEGITAVVCLDQDFDPVVLDDVLYLRFPFNDWKLGDQPPFWAETVRVLARLVNELRRAGHTVLVHCYAGLNRSGIVTARALMDDGMSAEQAIDAVRTARGEHALSNPWFEEWLRDEEHTAA